MKRGHGEHSRSRTFQSYIISYMSIVLIALALLSIAAAWLTAGRMKAEDIRLTESRLYTVTADMETQVATMRQTALEIASMQEFLPDYFEQDKYREVELLSLLERYGSRVAISDYYFIKYQGNQTIFTSQGTTMPLTLYFTERLPEADGEMATEEIESMCAEAEKPFAVFKDEVKALFIFPLQRYSVRGSGMEGVLCFEVTENDLAERVEQIAGKMDGQLTMYYEDTLLMGEAFEDEAECVERISDDETVKVTFYPDEKSYFSWGNVFSGREWIMLGTIAAILLAAALLAAYRSYRPVRRLVEKYKKTTGDDLGYDLESIDLLIDTLLRKADENSVRLRNQYQMLREQAIRLVASGEYTDGLKERLELLNIHLDAPVICRFSCSFEDRTIQMDTQIYQDIEDLSDDESRLYACWAKQGTLDILAAVGEEYQAEEVLESLQSLFEAKGMKAEVKTLELCHDLSRVGKKEIPHLEKNQDEANAGAPEEEEERAAGKQKSTALLAMKYIRENCTKYDLSLDLVAKEFNITSTYLCRLLKQQTGVSYKEYLTGLRIEVARKLLQNRNVSVTDVCVRTGYTNVSHFIKVFQKYTGVTPAKYRDEWQGGVETGRE